MNDFNELLKGNQKTKTTLCTVCKEYTKHIEFNRRDAFRIAKALNLKGSITNKPVSDLSYIGAAIGDLTPWSIIDGKMFVCSLCKHPSKQEGLLPQGAIYKHNYTGFDVHIVNLHKSPILCCLRYYSKGEWHNSKIFNIGAKDGGLVLSWQKCVTGRNIYLFAQDIDGKEFKLKGETPNNVTIDGKQKEFYLIKMPKNICPYAIKLSSFHFE
ncbi:hypothetical protein IQ255_20250 [Pleurocapsales cyanobacterium LEGE 10410]|nr:hypothetical protein [Pleurocapsales cyanobacterium LEGE 10410]